MENTENEIDGKEIDDERDREVFLSEQELKTLPTGYLTVHRGTGWKTLRSGQTVAALASLHRAAAAYPQDVSTLVARAKARETLKMYNKATEDAEKVCKLNSNDKDGIMVLGKCELGLSNFEQAAVMFNSGLNRRGNRKEFIEGMRAVRGILENTVGKFAGPALANQQTSIRQMLKKQKKQLEKPVDRRLNCLAELSKQPISNCTAEERRRKEKNLDIYNKKLCEIHLGRMAEDFHYFRSLMSRENETTIRDIAFMGWKETNHQLEHSKKQKPIYYMKNQPFFSKTIQDNKKKLKTQQDIKIGEIDRMFRNLKTFRAQHEIKNCSYEAHKIKISLETFETNQVSVKNKYLENLCQLMGLVYLDELKVSENLTLEENHQRIDCFLGFQPLYGGMWVHPTIQKSAFPFFNPCQWQKTLKEYISISDSNLEKSWLHYEVSRCYLIQKKWNHLVVEGKKSANYALLCQDLIWQINALCQVVIGQCHLKNQEDALEDLNEALECALQLQNQHEHVIYFLTQIKEVLEGKSDDAFYVNTNQIISKREKTILGLQKDAILKERTEQLLSRMKFLPAERRLGLVGGLRPVDEKGGSNNKSVIRSGTVGPLGLQPVTNTSYLQFCGVSKM